MSEDFDAQYLYQTENTGPLDTAGHRVISAEPARPSIAGPTPRYTAPASEASSAPPQVGRNPKPVQRGLPPPQLTPEQMMAMADAMTQKFLDDRNDLENQGPAAKRLGYGDDTNGFNTELTSGAEKAFNRSNYSGNDPGEDYDYRGSFAEGIGRDGNGHLPDTYKKPNHPTFSDESMYADYGKPGHWQGEVFQPYMDNPDVDRSQSDEYLQDRDNLRSLRDQQGRFGH